MMCRFFTYFKITAKFTDKKEFNILSCIFFQIPTKPHMKLNYKIHRANLNKIIHNSPNLKALK